VTGLVQRLRGDWMTPSQYSVARALIDRGDDVVPFEAHEMLGDGPGPTALARDTPVSGGVECVLAALRRLGLPEPRYSPEPPPSLRPFFGRAYWTATMGAIRMTERYEPPIHVKPIRRNKLFTGAVLRRRDDLIPLVHVDAKEPVLVQEFVDFVAEHRAYVLRDERILAVCRYAGDPLRFPDPGVVREAVAAYRLEAPAAYGLDFGVTADGRTLVVEANDGYALGNYGLRPAEYLRIVEARWAELAGGET